MPDHQTDEVCSRMAEPLSSIEFQGAAEKFRHFRAKHVHFYMLLDFNSLLQSLVI